MSTTNNIAINNDFLIENNSLIDAANSWKSLSDYEYIITYGYKNKLYSIKLSFHPEEFYHLAGFQYLKDLNLPRYNSRVTLDRIIEGKIKYEHIVKGAQYKNMVRPRLEALSRIKNSLDNDFILYTFMPQMYSFSTTIKADYLIVLRSDKTPFVFIVKSSSVDNSVVECVCCSAFMEGERNYEENQRLRTILKKERRNLVNGTIDVLYDKLEKNKI